MKAPDDDHPADVAAYPIMPPRGGWLWRTHPRLTIAAIIFVACGVLAWFNGLPLAIGLLLSFDLATVAFLAMTAVMFARFSPDAVRRRARAQDADAWSVLACCIALALVIVVSLVIELRGSHGDLGAVVLAVSSILLAWMFINAMFALHYAHRYYDDRIEGTGDLAFPGDENPDYWDFAYFSFVLGMTFQVSDVAIRSRRMRRIALVHGLVAFLFNVVIVALTVNLVAGRV